MRMRLIRTLILSMLLAGLSVEAASAQSIPITAKATQPEDTNGPACSEPANPQALNAEVNLCIDRLVKAYVQDIPGARLDVTVSLQNDLELLPTPDENQLAPRTQPVRATSWSPQAMRTQGLATAPAFSESATSSAVHLPAVTIWASTEIEDSASLTFASASTLDRKLTRARLRTQEEAKLRQSRQLQRDLNEHCRQMHLSNIECRLKLKNQKLSAIGHTGQSARSQPQANH